MISKNRNTGFTLIELAMVLFVIALILGGMLGPLATQQEGQERRQTTMTLEDLRDNLLGYAIVNGHFPCPDCPNSTQDDCVAVNTADPTEINDGEEDGVDGASNPVARGSYISCATEEGNFPWATLGVTEFDVWENRFVYRVTDDFADDVDGTGATCATAVGISFQICSVGNVTIQDEVPNTVASQVPALIVSYGRNVDDAGNPSSAFEQENQDVDTTFVDKEYSGVAANEFDDMLIWITRNNLIYKMIQAEQLP